MAVQERVVESVVREWDEREKGETDWYVVMEEPPAREENLKYLRYLERQINDKARERG